MTSAPRDWRRQRLLVSLGAAAPEMSNVADIVERVLGDMTATIADQAGLWGDAVPLVLKRALPRDTANPFKPALMRELLDPVELPAHEEELAGPLYQRVWNSIRAACESTPQATSIALVTGVSGVGKTKVAYDIGLRHAYTIISRVCEQDAPTAPWNAFFEFARTLIASAPPALPAPVASAPDLSSSPALSLQERMTLKSVLIVLQAAHLHWAVSVAEAAVEDANYGRAVDHTRREFPELSEPAAQRRVLREVVLRAQRNGLAYRHVCQVFVSTMRGFLLDDAVVHADATCELTSDRALEMLQAVVRQAGAVWGSDSPIVWCHDEVQALLAVDGIPADTFCGVYQRRDVTPTVTPESGRYNCFYGLLAAVRSVVSVVGCAHVLLGNSLDLTTDLLSEHSPVQGVSKSHDATVNLDPPAMRAWLGLLLTDAAMTDVTDDLLGRLRGRPLFISSFWQELVAAMTAARDAATPITPLTASELVSSALASARTQAFKDARLRIAALCERTAYTSYGFAPSALMSRLFHAAIMDGSAGSVEMLDGMRDEAKHAIERGILNVRGDSVSVSLAHEPITRDALRAVGVYRTMSTGMTEDDVMRQLAQPMTGAFGGGAQSPVAEDCFPWALIARSMRLHRAAGAVVSLHQLLQPFMSAEDAARLPAEFATLGVKLTHGINCTAALEDSSATACFLVLLEANPTALLHHTQETAGGADLAFMTWRIGAAAEPGRPVTLQLKNRSTGSLQAALRSLDLGTWYTDQIVKPAVTATETRSHMALRKLLARRPEFATPIRVIVAGRAYSPKTQLLVAWLNSEQLQACPIVLATLSPEGLGVDIRPANAGVYDHPSDYRVWWPTPIRHWAAPPAYPALPPLPVLPKVSPPAVSLRVKFKSTAFLTSVSKDELVALAGSFGELNGVPVRHRTVMSSVTVTFATLADAMAAVRGGPRSIRGATVEVAFV